MNHCGRSGVHVFSSIRWAGFLSLGLAAVVAGGCGGGNTVKLDGTGASFPAPLYETWFVEYGKDHPDVLVNYLSEGSGRGVTAVINGTADFGASDAAMTKEEMAEVEGGVQLLPMTAGSVVLAYNLKDVEALRLSRDAYVGIFLGEVTEWNDPLIAAANPDVDLPDTPIRLVVRADSSGTTFVFTKHLSTVSDEFADKVGNEKLPNWPVGTGAKGNEGVTAAIAETDGAIGYVEYGYASQKGLPIAALENQSGAFVAPTVASGMAALASVELPDDMIAWVADPAGEDAYPIVTYTWIICHKSYEAKKAAALKGVLEYCLTDGQEFSEKLGYLPLPETVRERCLAALDNIEAKAK